jgi:hypothetical protein
MLVGRISATHPPINFGGCAALIHPTTAHHANKNKIFFFYLRFLFLLKLAALQIKPQDQG